MFEQQQMDTAMKYGGLTTCPGYDSSVPMIPMGSGTSFI